MSHRNQLCNFRIFSGLVRTQRLTERYRRGYLGSQPPGKRVAFAEPWRCEYAYLAGCGAALDATLVNDGRATYLAEGCPACHGRPRSAGSMGPDVRRVRRHCNVAELTEYLATPATYGEQRVRLQRASRRCNSHMPSFAHLPHEQRAALAAYLLSRSPRSSAISCSRRDKLAGRRVVQEIVRRREEPS